MKVIVTTRTLNEEKNIRTFIESNEWADEVLIVDGGSDDDTVSIVDDYDYAFVKPFHERVNLKKGYWRNPHGKHINTCTDWAIERGADWLIFDDCDCFPNKTLRENVRNVLLDSTADVVRVTRLYLWGYTQHFPAMAKPGNGVDWCPSLWAWRPSANIRANEENPLEHDISSHRAKGLLHQDLMPPYCLLHRYCPDEETTDRKLKKYREGGQHPSLLHPRVAGGAIENLPEWAVL